MKIGIDLDDTLVDFGPSFIRWYNFHYGKDIKFNEVDTFDLSKVFDIPMTNVNFIISNFYKTHIFDKLPMMYQGKETLQGLPYYEKYLITARPIDTIPSTLRWLEKHLDNDFTAIIFEAKDKGKVCKDLSIDYMIDDGIHNIESCHKEDIKTILFDRPWNQGYDKTIRKYNWYDIYLYLRNDDTY